MHRPSASFLHRELLTFLAVSRLPLPKTTLPAFFPSPAAAAPQQHTIRVRHFELDQLRVRS